MKKFLKITGIIIALLLAALIVVPYFFKDKLVDKLKEEVNKQLNAKLDFEDVDLTFFAHFPNLTLEIEDFSLVGVDSFEGVELVRMESFELSLGLASVFKGGMPEILGIYIYKANVNALVDSDGKANWDIVKEGDPASGEEEVSSGEEEEFSIELSYYEIKESTIRYDDKSLATLMIIEGLDHSGRGNFGVSDFLLKTRSSIDNLFVEYENEVYVNNWRLEANIDMEVNMDEYRFTLTDNEIKLNELLLKAEGSIVMPDSAIFMDVNVEAPSLDFRQLYSLMPPSYTADMDGMTFSGSGNFAAWIKGEYSETSYPLFAIDLGMNNGTFKHKDLPKSAKNIQIKSHIELPDANDLDKLWIDISKFDMDLGGNMISSGFTLHHPETSMDFTARLSAAIDLETIKDVVPSEEGEFYTGSINANLNAEGSLAALEKEDYSALKASGKLQVQDFEYSSKQFSQPVLIKDAQMEFMMDEVNLVSFVANIGQSDFQAEGKLRDFIPYALFDNELYGELNFRSNNMNADELMAFMLEDSTDNASALETDTIKVADEPNPSAASSDSIVALFPQNIHFLLSTGINTLIYDGYELRELKGEMELEKGILTIQPTTAKAFGGNMSMSGKIDESIPSEPYTELQISLNEMNIKECASKVEMVQKYAPVAKYTSGTFSGKVKLSTLMDRNWDPIYASVYSKGNIKTKGVKIEGFALLDKLAAITKMESILNQEFENVDMEYEIIDGKGYIKPFDFRIDQLKGNSFGSIDLDQNIDFDVNMEVPTAMLGEGAGMLMGQIAGALSSFGLQSEVPEKINMNIKITGKVDNPKITPNFAGLSPANAKEVVKETIKEEIDKAVDDAMAKAAEEAEKIMKEARAKADALLVEAQKNVDKLKKEGYEQADKLVSDAKGMLEQIAAKAAAAEMKKQIDKQAANAMAEARKQADKIIEDAQKQADRLKK